MDLDVFHTAYRYQMVPHSRRDLIFPDCGDRELHGEKPVCITAEGLPVKKIAPPSNDLAGNKSHAYCVRCLRKIHLFHSAENVNRDGTDNDPPIDRQAAVSGIEYLYQVVFIVFP